MSEIKHTPGPWRIAGKYKGDHGSFWLETEFPMPVFELVPVIGVPGEHLANARLIAAAPDLLEALQECEDYFDNRADADCDQDGYIPNKEMLLLQVVREALKKAGAE